MAGITTTRTRNLLPTTRDGGAHDDGARGKCADNDGAGHAGELARAVAICCEPATAIYGTTRERHELPAAISASEPTSGNDGYAVCRIQPKE